LTNGFRKSSIHTESALSFKEAYRRRRNELKEWQVTGQRVLPPPHIVKQRIVREHIRLFAEKPVFIETGTYEGEMVHAVKRYCKKIYSIEVDEILYQKASVRFSGAKNISIIHGDSAHALPALLSQIHEPCLFWLDGHYSGGTTSKGERDTSVMQELLHIFNHDQKNHVILIDDARFFKGENDYPTLETVKEFTLDKAPAAVFEVSNDIIRIRLSK
jgi:hypothetical protein